MLQCYLDLLDDHVFIVSGETDYQSDHSLQMADHMVNGTVYDDAADDSYEPTDHMISANVQVTPQKRRGYGMHTDITACSCSSAVSCIEHEVSHF